MIRTTTLKPGDQLDLVDARDERLGTVEMGPDGMLSFTTPDGVEVSVDGTGETTALFRGKKPDARGSQVPGGQIPSGRQRTPDEAPRPQIPDSSSPDLPPHADLLRSDPALPDRIPPRTESGTSDPRMESGTSDPASVGERHLALAREIVALMDDQLLDPRVWLHGKQEAIDEVARRVAVAVATGRPPIDERDLAARAEALFLRLDRIHAAQDAVEAIRRELEDLVRTSAGGLG